MVGYVLTGILSLAELYDHIEWPVVVLLGSMIPLGAALETSGGTELIASGLVDVTRGLPAWAVLTIIMVVTMSLSDVLNNTATAADGSAISNMVAPVCADRQCQAIFLTDATAMSMRVISFLGATFPNGTQRPQVAFRLP